VRVPFSEPEIPGARDKCLRIVFLIRIGPVLNSLAGPGHFLNNGVTLVKPAGHIEAAPLRRIAHIDRMAHIDQRLGPVKKNARRKLMRE